MTSVNLRKQRWTHLPIQWMCRIIPNSSVWGTMPECLWIHIWQKTSAGRILTFQHLQLERWGQIVRNVTKNYVNKHYFGSRNMTLHHLIQINSFFNLLYSPSISTTLAIPPIATLIQLHIVIFSGIPYTTNYYADSISHKHNI